MFYQNVLLICDILKIIIKKYYKKKKIHLIKLQLL